MREDVDVEAGEQPPKIKGIFSMRQSAPGSVKSYWFAKETSAGKILIDALDENFKRVDPQDLLTREVFLKTYTLEPELWYKQVTFKLFQGDAYAGQSRWNEAEKAYKDVLRIDEENIRATFGLGMVYLAWDQPAKAQYVFDRLVSLDETFAEEHKHIFNEFGIHLRKKGMYEQAMKYYGRALELSPEDEHLHVNMARACFESGNVEEAFQSLAAAFRLNPDLEAARHFTRYLYQERHKPEDEAMHEYLVLMSRRRPKSA